MYWLSHDVEAGILYTSLFRLYSGKLWHKHKLLSFKVTVDTCNLKHWYLKLLWYEGRWKRSQPPFLKPLQWIWCIVIHYNNQQISSICLIHQVADTSLFTPTPMSAVWLFHRPELCRSQTFSNSFCKSYGIPYMRTFYSISELNADILERVCLEIFCRVVHNRRRTLCKKAFWASENVSEPEPSSESLYRNRSLVYNSLNDCNLEVVVSCPNQLEANIWLYLFEINQKWYIIKLHAVVYINLVVYVYIK